MWVALALAAVAGLALWHRLSWTVTAVICAAVLLLVAGAASQGWLAGDARHLLILAGLLGLIAVYGYGIGWLREHARAVPAQGSTRPAEAVPPADRTVLSDAELDRYARHIMLRELGGPGQRRLKGARVLVVGAGALGSPVGLYLTAAGVGHLTLADDDVVSLSNLQRQVLYQTADVGQRKVDAALHRLAALNPHVQLTALLRRITADDRDFVAGFDLVIDGTDQFASRQGINAACVAAGVPLLAGSIAQWEGQVTLYDPTRGGPCLSCLFPIAPAAGLAPSCAEAGVIGALPGVIGSIVALEAIKHLTGAGQGLRGQMLIFDGLYGETRRISLRPNPECSVCNGAVHA